MSDLQLETLGFEDALKDLQDIVYRLERGDASLSAALEDFERGVRLVRLCSKMLETMELRVEQLLVTQDGEITLEPFDTRNLNDPNRE